MELSQKRLKLFQDLYQLQDNEIDFTALCLNIYDYQKTNNPLYRSYLEAIGRLDMMPKSLQDIAYLPIQLFKSYEVKSDLWIPEKKFLSSGTGGKQSQHLVRDVSFYRSHTQRIFENLIGPIKDYCFLALLPGYLERKGSSLIEMVDHFIIESGHPDSGFYLNNYEALSDKLNLLKNSSQPVILFGVSFALLDFVGQHQPSMDHTIIVETGGMKSSHKELTKHDILQQLRDNTNAKAIYSEYGMTELLSQAYAKDAIHFELPPFMKVDIKEITDPFSSCRVGKAGQINIIDLANIDTCSFIQTQDIGRLDEEGRLELLGRLDFSDIRGCNLLLEED